MKYIIVMGSGGHTKRGLKISKNIEGDFKFVIPFESKFSKEKIGKNKIEVVSPRFKAKSNVLLTIIRTLFLFFHSIFILIWERPDAVISTGSGLSYPFLMMAKMLKIKTFYIESPSRIYKLSKTGEMLFNKVDVWLAAWEELADNFNVDYIGCLY